MQNKGYVLIGFIGFGLGALLAFVFNIDSENVTILSVAAIAGLLSYMTIFVTEENKNNENNLNEIKKSAWLYLDEVSKYTLIIGHKLLETKKIRAEKKEIDELCAVIEGGEGSKEQKDSLKDKYEALKPRMDEHLVNSHVFSREIFSCQIKAVELVDAVSMYESICFKSEKISLDEIKNCVFKINKSLKRYRDLDNLFVKEDLKEKEEFFLLNTIDENDNKLRRGFSTLRMRRDVEVLKKKKEILVYVYILVVWCLGYLVSTSYSVTS